MYWVFLIIPAFLFLFAVVIQLDTIYDFRSKLMLYNAICYQNDEAYKCIPIPFKFKELKKMYFDYKNFALCSRFEAYFLDRFSD